MVKKYILLLLFISHMLSAEIRMTAEILDVPPTNEGLLTGLIRIRQNINDNVDINSFTIQGKTLETQFLGFDQVQDPTVKQTTNSDVISKYQFFLKAEKGMQLLPPISVSIDGKKYSSVASTYKITQLSSSKYILRLEAEIQAEQPFYVGQRANFIYRIFFNENIDLTKEDLPLLEPKGFLKVGPLQVKNYTQDNFNVNELIQAVQSTAPGKYTFPLSVVEGKAYKIMYGTQKIYMEPPLRGEVPEIHLTVQAFAEPDKPASFTGATGQFTLSVKSLSPSKVFVGDTIQLEIVIKGNGVLDSLTLPDLSCQPGFSGFFSVNPVPVAVKSENNTKTFVMAIRPLTILIKMIPPVEFAYFNPEQKAYQLLQSKEIPLSVESPPIQEITSSTPSLKEIPLTDWKKIYGRLPSIDIAPNLSVTSVDFINKALSLWTILTAIGLGCFLLYILNKYRPYLQKKHTFDVQQALALSKQKRNDRYASLAILETLLKEIKNTIPLSQMDSYHKLTQDIEAARYNHDETYSIEDFIFETEKLVGVKNEK